MENFSLSEDMNASKQLDPFGDDSSKIKILGVIVDGIPTDIVFCDYRLVVNIMKHFSLSLK